MRMSEEEIALIAALRRLRAEEMRLSKVPDELLRHGEISIAEARKLLGCGRAEATRLVKAHRLPTILGRIPISEVRREFEKRNREHLRQLTFEIERRVRPKALGRVWLLPEHGGFGVPHVASTLGVSEREVRRLIVDGPLFAWRDRRGGLTVMAEELQAYQRAHSKPTKPTHESATASSVRGTRMRRVPRARRVRKTKMRTKRAS